MRYHSVACSTTSLTPPATRLTTQNSIDAHVIPVIRVYSAGSNVIDSRYEKFASIHPSDSAASTFCRSHVALWISCIGICSNGARACEERPWLSDLPGSFSVSQPRPNRHPQWFEWSRLEHPFQNGRARVGRR